MNISIKNHLTSTHIWDVKTERERKRLKELMHRFCALINHDYLNRFSMCSSTIYETNQMEKLFKRLHIIYSG